MIKIDANTMRKVTPRFIDHLAERQSAITNVVGKVLTATLQIYWIDSRLRIAHFLLAQTCYGSAEFYKRIQ
ncbi:hypothetical protein [Sphaerotilus sp.]|uniref:hypothetical protein n=1 Tax=Sphaerotilus sp. TaxID=2093942 RepID=UPI00286DC4E0|nr:hypothetical protein [Sphaerotilus sp.]